MTPEKRKELAREYVKYQYRGVAWKVDLAPGHVMAAQEQIDWLDRNGWLRDEPEDKP